MKKSLGRVRSVTPMVTPTPSSTKYFNSTVCKAVKYFKRRVPGKSSSCLMCVASVIGSPTHLPTLLVLPTHPSTHPHKKTLILAPDVPGYRANRQGRSSAWSASASRAPGIYVCACTPTMACRLQGMYSTPGMANARVCAQRNTLPHRGASVQHNVLPTTAHRYAKKLRHGLGGGR